MQCNAMLCYAMLMQIKKACDGWWRRIFRMSWACMSCHVCYTTQDFKSWGWYGLIACMPVCLHVHRWSWWRSSKALSLSLSPRTSCFTYLPALKVSLRCVSFHSCLFVFSSTGRPTSWLCFVYPVNCIGFLFVCWGRAFCLRIGSSFSHS